MSMKSFLKIMAVGVVLGGLAAMGGCGRSAASLDAREERDPVLKRAVALKNVNDIDGAIELYNKALERKPWLARGHLEVGLLYDTEKQDYIRAIYHYQRYLELRPQTEKTKLIQDLIRQARLSFAASLPMQPGGAVEEIAILKREIAALKGELSNQQGGGAGAKAAKPAVATAAAAAPVKAAPGPLQPPKPEPAQPAVQTYVVQSGDTLSSIASKVYKDSGKWKQIYDANRSTLSSPESARVGQTLIIPR